jgi:hypothetical protein
MAERYIPEHRRTQFKAKGTFKPEELRRRREEQQVEIRKAKREENLAKRRGITGGDGLSLRGAALGAAPESDDDTAPTESQVRENKLLYRMIFSFPYRDSRVTTGSSGPPNIHCVADLSRVRREIKDLRYRLAFDITRGMRHMAAAIS